MIGKFWIIVFSIASSIVCVAGQNLPGVPGRSVAERRHRQEETVMGYLRDVAWSSRKAIRLYYRADCQPMKDSVVDYSVPFPFFPLQAPSPDKTGVEAVREIFKNAQDVRIAEEPRGIIRIWIGKVPTEILRTRISLLTLDRQAQYDPSFAIGAIESTKELEATETSLGVREVPNVGGLVAPAENGLPSLPASLKNLTVDEALDMIAKTWGGPVVFGACTAPTDSKGRKLFWIGNSSAVLGKRF